AQRLAFVFHVILSLSYSVRVAAAMLIILSVFFLKIPRPTTSTLFPYTTLFRSWSAAISSRPSARPASPGSTSIACSSRSSVRWRSEEHTSELQSRSELVCRLLLEKKNRTINTAKTHLHRALLRLRDIPCDPDAA